ncbi:hypothetical protein KP509_03G099400 [Ceratopteris richardii]|nr:hypothetical protein KP509_03G099400 [Ceratopteris richardii]
MPLSAGFKRGGRIGLSLSAQNDLVLADEKGVIVWAVRSGSVAALDLRDDGNLVIYSAENHTLWQSFDDHGDVLLQGQALGMGQEIVSSNSAYAAKMEAGGLLFYMRSSSVVPMAYFLLALNKTVEDSFNQWMEQGIFPLGKSLGVNFTDALHSRVAPPSPACTLHGHAEYSPFAVLMGENFTLHYAQACSSELNVSWPVLYYFQNHILGKLHNSDFVRLDGDGIIRGYTYFNNRGEHLFSSDRENFSFCFAPNACGAHSLCSPYAAGEQHRCKCPSIEEDPAFYNTFVPVDPHDSSLGCRRTVPLQCRKDANQSLVKMDGATFISFRAFFEVSATDNVVPLEDCLRRCASNCSCTGLYYYKAVSFCLPFSEEMPIANVSLLSLYSQEFVTYLKVQFDSVASDVVAGQKAYTRLDRTNSSWQLLLAIIVGGILTLFCVGAFLAWIYKHKAWSRDRKLFADENDSELEDILPSLPTRFSHRELRTATSGFSKLVGKGGFGSVFEGVLPDSRRVAVKRLETISPQLKPFLTEVATIGSISHLNIVRLCGFCSERSHRLLVYEYMENGSLDYWLFNREGCNIAGEMSEMTPYEESASQLSLSKDNEDFLHLSTSCTGSKGKRSDRSTDQGTGDGGDGHKRGRMRQARKIYSVLSWKSRYAIALGTARALAYLHDDLPRPIIHFDIKPENILLDADFTPKLSDFGLAKLVERGASSVYTVARGTAGYMAPEWLSHSVVTRKCDVYSYGMVLFELVGGRRNADPLHALTDRWYLPNWAAACCRAGREEELVDRRLHGNYDTEQAKKLVQIALLCVLREPNLRPSMSTICKLLEGSLEITSHHIKLGGNMDSCVADQNQVSLVHLLQQCVSQYDNTKDTCAGEAANMNSRSASMMYSSIQGR